MNISFHPQTRGVEISVREIQKIDYEQNKILNNTEQQMIIPSNRDQNIPMSKILDNNLK